MGGPLPDEHRAISSKQKDCRQAACRQTGRLSAKSLSGVGRRGGETALGVFFKDHRAAEAAGRGVAVIEVNKEKTPLSQIAAISILGLAGEIPPKLICDSFA